MCLVRSKDVTFDYKFVHFFHKRFQKKITVENLH